MNAMLIAGSRQLSDAVTAGTAPDRFAGRIADGAEAAAGVLAGLLPLPRLDAFPSVERPSELLLAALLNARGPAPVDVPAEGEAVPGRGERRQRFALGSPSVSRPRREPMWWTDRRITTEDLVRMAGPVRVPGRRSSPGVPEKRAVPAGPGNTVRTRRANVRRPGPTAGGGTPTDRTNAQDGTDWVGPAMLESRKRPGSPEPAVPQGQAGPGSSEPAGRAGGSAVSGMASAAARSAADKNPADVATGTRGRAPARTIARPRTAAGLGLMDIVEAGRRLGDQLVNGRTGRRLGGLSVGPEEARRSILAEESGVAGGSARRGGSSPAGHTAARPAGESPAGPARVAARPAPRPGGEPLADAAAWPVARRGGEPSAGPAGSASSPAPRPGIGPESDATGRPDPGHASRPDSAGQRWRSRSRGSAPSPSRPAVLFDLSRHFGETIGTDGPAGGRALRALRPLPPPPAGTRTIEDPAPVPQPVRQPPAGAPTGSAEPIRTDGDAAAYRRDPPGPGPDDLPSGGRPVMDALADPPAANVFNVTVHMGGGTSDDDNELAERLSRILVDEAQRHGIDLR
jgi:hypothetical protein